MGAHSGATQSFSDLRCTFLVDVEHSDICARSRQVLTRRLTDSGRSTSHHCYPTHCNPASRPTRMCTTGGHAGPARDPAGEGEMKQCRMEQ
jgi:hypothetical protein